MMATRRLLGRAAEGTVWEDRRGWLVVSMVGTRWHDRMGYDKVVEGTESDGCAYILYLWLLAAIIFDRLISLPYALKSVLS
jgi:hypothetical protein